MICNLCGYAHKHYTYDNKTGETTYPEGSSGEFYKLPIEMKRDRFFDIETQTVVGCPSCGNVQLDI